MELLLRAFGGRFARIGNPWIEGGTFDCWVNFSAIPDHIGALSGGEQRLLMIAASLGADNEPVDLSYAVSGLDWAMLALVLAAISHAAGSHQHTEFLPLRSRTEPWSSGSRARASSPARCFSGRSSDI